MNLWHHCTPLQTAEATRLPDSNAHLGKNTHTGKEEGGGTSKEDDDKQHQGTKSVPLILLQILATSVVGIARRISIGRIPFGKTQSSTWLANQILLK